MGDRWVENFVLRMRGQMFLSNYKRYFYFEILRYENFRRNREKCSALQKMPKNGRNLQRNAFFYWLINIRLEI